MRDKDVKTSQTTVMYIMAMTVIIVSLGAVIGRMLGIDHLAAWTGETLGMATNTAVCFILLSLAFLYCAKGQGGG